MSRIPPSSRPITATWSASTPRPFGRSPTRSSPGSRNPIRVPVLWRYADLRETCAALLGTGLARKGRPPRHLSQQSRPQGRRRRLRLALFRPAGDEAGRGRLRAHAFGFGLALHHGGQGRLYGGRRPQDDAGRKRFRADAERHLARARRVVRRHRMHLAGRARHSAGQRAGSQFLRRASRPEAAGHVSGRRRHRQLGRAGPGAGERRLEQALFAAAQIRVGADLRVARPATPRSPTARLTTAC